MKGPDIGEAPLDVDVGACRVPACDFKGCGIRIHTHHAIGTEEFRGDRQDPVPASEVDRGPTVDIALRIGEVTNLGRDSGRRQILLRRRHRAGEPVERLQDSLKPDLLRRLTPSSGVLTPRPTPTCA